VPKQDRSDEAAQADPTKTAVAVARWQAGDRRAFEELWNELVHALDMHLRHDSLPRISKSIRAKLAIDDLLQSTAVEAVSSVANFRFVGPGSLKAWLTRIAENQVSTAVKYWASQKRDVRRERVADDSHIDLPPSPASAGPGPATHARRSEHLERVKEAIGQLEDRQRRIVVDRYFWGMPWAEVRADVGAASDAMIMKEFRTRVLPALGDLLRQSGVSSAGL
jgi:RNA polymerase sigma factor (sigma-70 family)